MKIKQYPKRKYARPLYEADDQQQPAAAPAAGDNQQQPAAPSDNSQQPAANNNQQQPAADNNANNANNNANNNQQQPAQETPEQKYTKVNTELYAILTNYITSTQQIFSSDAVKQNAPTMVAEMSAANSPIAAAIKEFSDNVAKLTAAKPDASNPQTVTDAIAAMNNTVASVSNLLKANTEAIANAAKQPQQTEGEKVTNESLAYSSSFRSRLYSKLYSSNAERFISKNIR